DGDPIRGVILGSADNHGGRTQSVTAPNGAAQQSLIEAAYRIADVDPESVGLIEAHGTGTELGDPIEFNALLAAFGSKGTPGHCALASAKATVGHLEAAAGVAGVLATLMAIRRKTVPPLPEAAADPNPALALSGSVFRLLAKAEAWGATADTPRRAGVSSFGFGGSNAHVIIEEPPAGTNNRPEAAGPLVFPVSARGDKRLAATLVALHAHIAAKGADAADLAAIAYTLQTGREVFANRIAIVATELAGLISALSAACDGTDAPGVFRGRVGANAPANEPDATADVPIEALAAAWAAGSDVDWASHWQDPPRRIHLPGVVLLPRRFALPALPTDPTSAAGSRLVELSETLPDGTHRYVTTLAPDHHFLADHVVSEKMVLPGVVGFAMLREAARLAAPTAHVTALRTVSWLRPVELSPTASALVLETRLRPHDRGFSAEIRHGDAVHLTCRITVADEIPAAPPPCDIPAIRARCNGTVHESADAARIFASRGFVYGETFRGLIRIVADRAGREALAELRPHANESAALPPDILEAALQSALGVLGDRPEDAYLPYAVGTLVLHAAAGRARYAHVHQVSEAAGNELPRLDISLLDEAGAVLVSIGDYAVRRAGQPARQKRSLFAPRWTVAPLPAASSHQRIAYLADPNCPLGPPPGADLLTALPEAVDAPVVNALPLTLSPDSGPEQALQASLWPAVTLARRGQPFQMLALHAGNPAAAALGAFGAALRQEMPGCRVTAVEVDPALSASAFPALFAAEIEAQRADVERPNEIAWRADGRREARRFAPLAMPESAEPAALKSTIIVTGGAGGLGSLVAHHIARHVPGASLVLAGRRAPDGAIASLLSDLEALGASAIYHPGDLAERGAADTLVAVSRRAFGPVRTVIHAAGLVDDRPLAQTPQSDLAALLRPKIDATRALDLATAEEPLELFLAFTSLSGVRGVAGQTFYAFANAWLDRYIEARAASPSPGRSLAIAWPLWREGGMRAPKAMVQLMEATLGIAPMTTEGGLALLDAAIAQGAEPNVVALEGPTPRLDRHLVISEESPAPEPKPSVAAHAAMDELLAKMAEVLRLEPDEVGPDDDFTDLGLDSITNIELATFLNERFGLEETPVLFFEHRTLTEVMETLLARHGTIFGEVAPSATLPSADWRTIERDDEAVAIIGLAARLPGAADLDGFWQHLVAGADLVTEVPGARWDWRAIEGDPLAEAGRTNSRWGAFLSDADCFDAAFFSISPREARLMDPQQRLALETVWHALEDAAIAPASLAGSRTGVFLGVTNTDYSELLRDRGGGGMEFLYDSGNGHAFLANRISHRLDLRGPSEPIDTLCSSSLVALHRASEAVLSGDCSMALAGGVSVIASPRLHVSFATAGMLSPTGRCRAFDHRADGFVRGEGAGIAVLKRLSDAAADGDRILAVIRGGAVNHGGRTASLTTPSPAAQAALVAEAWGRSRVDPAAAGLIEAHGTGTSLGDPIEVEALQRAFAELAGRSGSSARHVALGSVKSNIGHLEAAAGIAGVVKAVLSLRHRIVPPTIHVEAPNPHLKFGAGPLHLAREAEDWSPQTGPGGAPLRRAAGVSSFGAGGVNAHIVIEEAPTQLPATEDDGALRVLPLSAADPERLGAMAGHLADHLEHASGVSLADVAFTLQTGRDALAERLAIVATDRATAIGLLRHAAGGGTQGVHRGTVRRGKREQESPADSTALAQAFVSGTLGRWPTARGRRIALPLYPFARERYWFDPVAADIDGPAIAAPSETTGSVSASPLRETGAIHFAADAPLLRDHVVGDGPALPGAAALAFLLDCAPRGHGLADVTFLRPLRPSEGAVSGSLTVEGERFALMDPAGLPAIEGRFGESASPGEPIDTTPDAAANVMGAAALYGRFEAQGMHYGPTLRVVRRIASLSGEAFAELALPSGAEPFLSEALLDGGLQAMAGLMPHSDGPVMPFAIESVERHGAFAPAAIARVQRVAGGDAPRFDIALADQAGLPLATMRGVVVRAAVPSPLGIYVPVWARQDEAQCDAQVSGRLGVRQLGPAADALADALVRSVPAERLVLEPAHAETMIVVAGFAGEIAPEAFEIAARALLAIFHDLEQDLAREIRLVTFAPQGTGLHPAAAGLHAMARAACREMPQLDLVAFDVSGVEFDVAAHRILREPGSGDGTPVLLRPGGSRLVRRLEASGRSAPAAGTGLRRNGRYLIAGGAGGLGLDLAEWLVKERGGRVLLVGRREQAQLSASTRTRLEAARGAIVYHSADICDMDSTVAAVAAARDALGGPLHVAIHAAMVLADGAVSSMGSERLSAALDPKVRGSLNLARAVAGEPLDALVFFSSVQPFAGGEGQANYVAGCAFQDALALRLAGSAPYKVRLVNWGYWGSIGAVATEAYRRRLGALGVGSIEPAEGWAALDALVSGDEPARVVFRGDQRGRAAIGVVEAAKTQPAATFESGVNPTVPSYSETAFIDAFAQLEAHARHRVLQTLHALGLPLDGSSRPIETLQVAPTHRDHLLPALIAMLVRAGLVLEPLPGKIAAVQGLEVPELPTDPLVAAPAALMNACLSAYGELLAGERTAADVIMPGGRQDLLEGLYKDNPRAARCNRELADALASHLAARPAAAPLRILEVGAGTGATTAAILPAISAFSGRITYDFTDIGPAFVERGRERFGSDRSWFTACRFDVERDAAAQGFTEPYDAIVATNVLHATADLSESVARLAALLRPGGALFLNELTEPHDYDTIVFGLFEGWWRATDRREPHSPVVSATRWRELLAAAGLRALPARAAEDHGQTVFVAQRPTSQVREPQRQPSSATAINAGAPSARAVE
ncbi:MAG: SDR family NAD(P)-dependent oxidoreductase, partial [Pseudomonadota bacterium]